MYKFSLSLFSVSLALAGQARSWTQKQLIGLWQKSPEIAAGWNETYAFFPDGKVDFHENQMDPYRRVVTRSGKYKLVGSTLTITFSKETVLVGGKKIPLEKVGDDDEGYVGAKIVDRKIIKPMIVRIALGHIKTIEGHPSTLFGKARYWHMENDPSKYN